LQLTYSWATIKDVQAAGEAFSPQKRTFGRSKDEIVNCFIFFWAIFALLDPDCESGSRDQGPHGILIQSGSTTLLRDYNL
jgi:hypothetical protein